LIEGCCAQRRRWSGGPPLGRSSRARTSTEQVVFASFFERGFNLPVGDFFRGLLYYYRLELVHLVLNSITIVSTFIHFL
jgi:hypothetical protein